MSQEASQVEIKLDTLIRLMALNLVGGVGSVSERAVALSRAGITPKDIASILGADPGTIRDALYNAKRSSGKGKTNGSKGKAKRQRQKSNAR